MAGCATTEEIEARARIAAEQRAIYEAQLPRCSSDKECQAKWSAARRWVLDHCAFKLEHVTDDFLETYNSRDMASTGMWCRVTKSPISETEYRIELENGVNNPFALGGPSSAKSDFNDYVNSAWTASR